MKGATMRTICITRSLPACDGMLHITEKILLPGMDPDLYPPVDRTVYDILPQQLYPKLEVESSCNQTLWDAMTNESSLSALLSIWDSMPSARYMSLLNSSAVSITLFAMNNQAISGFTRIGTAAPPN
jgi:hypothetical protein